jgi:hypothetical protein
VIDGHLLPAEVHDLYDLTIPAAERAERLEASNDGSPFPPNINDAKAAARAHANKNVATI